MMTVKINDLIIRSVLNSLVEAEDYSKNVPLPRKKPLTGGRSKLKVSTSKPLINKDDDEEEDTLDEAMSGSPMSRADRQARMDAKMKAKADAPKPAAISKGLTPAAVVGRIIDKRPRSVRYLGLHAPKKPASGDTSGEAFVNTSVRGIIARKLSDYKRKHPYGG